MDNVVYLDSFLCHITFDRLCLKFLSLPCCHHFLTSNMSEQTILLGNDSKPPPRILGVLGLKVVEIAFAIPEKIFWS